MRCIKRVFAELDIPFWLHAGTLLGCVRHGDFIPHDDDIDIAVWGDTPLHHRIVDAFCEEGFRLHLDFGGRDIPGHQYAMWTPRGIYFDIFFATREGDRQWTALWLDQQHFKRAFYPLVTEFTTLPLCGEEFPVPKNFVDYLVMNYGPEWTQVISNWDWTCSLKNLEK
jgi:hypothetical protein